MVGPRLGDGNSGQTRRRLVGTPPQRYNPTAAGSDRNPVSMKPPRFDGSEATNWIARVQYYFNHVMMPDAQRLHYAVMLFDPPASEWVFNYCANNEFVTWHEFLEDVRHRFDRQSFKDYFGLIAKLTQTGSVLEYHDTFEKYLNRVHGVPEAKLYTLFVAGLKADIRERLTLHRPTSLAAAMALALEIADTQSDRINPQPVTTFQRRQWSGRDIRPTVTPLGTHQPSPMAAVTSTTTGQKNLPREPPCQPLIRVSQAERSERSRLGLCWHCPEKWVIGHVCKQRILCYADEDEGMTAAEVGEVREEETLTDVAHINSLDGGRRSRPLKVVGRVKNREISILVDTGSDRDFLHPDIAEYVILGMDWLESLGKISANFANKTLEFVHNGEPFTLQGITVPPRRLNAHSIMTLHSAANVGACFEIVLLELETDTAGLETFPGDLPAGIAGVLENFRAVFRVPTEMPPPRQYDHRIHLQPGSKPVNARPYRYPYFQKNEIERQVREMLEQGIIQRSNSPFSSPVLLIRKKDGSFRFCIDYRALNNATRPLSDPHRG
ncbi:uncharacterized protein LOC121770393 [Salvia splendens]|uniref:uncharacterized protein LOC121770393 n=1 Tax=Salvia splendens TaxID=180675 RepID=UPI001C27D522|nr:uncharacterized protein LOC121770393 [Salvia splendens]